MENLYVAEKIRYIWGKEFTRGQQAINSNASLRAIDIYEKYFYSSLLLEKKKTKTDSTAC